MKDSMKFMGFAKMKHEGLSTSFDDILLDIGDILEREKKKKRGLPLYILRTLKAAHTEIVALREAKWVAATDRLTEDEMRECLSMKNRRS